MITEMKAAEHAVAHLDVIYNMYALDFNLWFFGLIG